jgi:hypothetical protein
VDLASGKDGPHNARSINGRGIVTTLEGRRSSRARTHGAAAKVSVLARPIIETAPITGRFLQTSIALLGDSPHPVFAI